MERAQARVGNAVDEHRAEIHRYRRHGGADHPEHRVSDQRFGGSGPRQREALPEIFSNPARSTLGRIGTTTHCYERQITSGSVRLAPVGGLQPSEPWTVLAAIEPPRPRRFRLHGRRWAIHNPFVPAFLATQLDDDHTRPIARTR